MVTGALIFASLRRAEQTDWGACRTEFYPTYDFIPVWESKPRRRA